MEGRQRRQLKLRLAIGFALIGGSLFFRPLPDADAACKLKCSTNPSNHQWGSWSSCSGGATSCSVTRPPDSCPAGTSGKKVMNDHRDDLIATTNCNGTSCPGWSGSVQTGNSEWGCSCIPC
jgi:hypothetical protein